VKEVSPAQAVKGFIQNPVRRLPSGAVADGPLFVRVLVDLHRTTKIHPVVPAAGVQDSA